MRVLPVGLLLFLSTVAPVFAQTHPCDQPAAALQVEAGLPFRLRWCQDVRVKAPDGSMVPMQIADFRLTVGAVSQIISATSLGGQPSQNGKTEWEYLYGGFASVGQRSLRLEAWNWETDANGQQTGQRQFSPPVDVTVDVVPATTPTTFSVSLTLTDPSNLNSAQRACWIAPTGRPPRDWIGWFVAGELGEYYWIYTDGKTSGCGNAPGQPLGKYIARYGLDDAYNFVANSEILDTLGSNPVPVDCQGTWSAETCAVWSPCVNETRVRDCTRTFTVTQQPANGGQACPTSPEVRSESQACQPPPPLNVLAPVPTSCRWTLRATPPDSTAGWRAQFRQNGANVGQRDTTAPFERTFNVLSGEFVYDVLWTKASGTSQASLPLMLKCK
jgi:hypothetical protein